MSEDTTHTKPEKNLLKKEAEYELYKIWKSLPAILRKADPDTLKKFGLTNYKDLAGFEDEVSELLDIKTQGQFAERFGVNKDTLSEWNARILKENDGMTPMKRWARQLSPNILFSIYRKLERDPDGSLAKIWFQIAEDWNEKSEIGAIGGGPLYPTMTDKEAEDALQRALDRKKRLEEGKANAADSKPSST